eukprot:m.164552 g.164552  ORF g.164552 m.164552 type:complete len:350 (-) comp12441_c0_seq1:639-1688(-)
MKSARQNLTRRLKLKRRARRRSARRRRKRSDWHARKLSARRLPRQKLGVSLRKSVWPQQRNGRKRRPLVRQNLTAWQRKCDKRSSRWRHVKPPRDKRLQSRLKRIDWPERRQTRSGLADHPFAPVDPRPCSVRPSTCNLGDGVSVNANASCSAPAPHPEATLGARRPATWTRARQEAPTALPLPVRPPVTSPHCGAVSVSTPTVPRFAAVPVDWTTGRPCVVPVAVLAVAVAAPTVRPVHVTVGRPTAVATGGSEVERCPSVSPARRREDHHGVTVTDPHHAEAMRRRHDEAAERTTAGRKPRHGGRQGADVHCLPSSNVSPDSLSLPPTAPCPSTVVACVSQRLLCKV